MSILGTTAYTLADMKARMAPDGAPAKIIELLTKTNRILDDAVWQEGNLPTGHRISVRSGLPTAYFRLFNQGVPRSKDKTRQVNESCGLMHANCVVDVDEAELNGNRPEFFLSKNMAFVEAMNQQMATTLFYGNTNIDPEQFMGLAPRFPYSDAPNVINFGDSGSACTSIWLIGWAVDRVSMIYPKGDSAGAGLKMNDYEKKAFFITDDDGNEFPVYRNWYTWKPGLAVQDWRYVVRICNIDTTDFTSDALRDALIDAYYKLPTTDGAAIYCNQTIMAALTKEAANKSNTFHTMKDPFGKPVTMFYEMPLRRCDNILNTETALTATP